MEPKYGCGGTPSAQGSIRAVQRYAAERRLRLNTGHIDRYQPPCDMGVRDIAGSDPTTSAYVFLHCEVAAQQARESFPAGAGLRCHELDIATLCRWP